jgi:phosphoribosylglycinamide formyltransferase-1
MKIAVFISGRGSNLKALLDNAAYYTVKLIVSNNHDALGLKINPKIPAHVCRRKDFSSYTEYANALTTLLHQYEIELIVLAGFMEILREEFLKGFPRKIINIHPSLLPAFPGLNTHERAILSKTKEHGATVHLVDSGIDTGPLIASGRVKVEESDTVETLASKVLEVEHRLLPWCVNQIAQGKIILNPTVTLTEEFQG